MLGKGVKVSTPRCQPIGFSASSDGESSGTWKFSRNDEMRFSNVSAPGRGNMMGDKWRSNGNFASNETQILRYCTTHDGR